MGVEYSLVPVLFFPEDFCEIASTLVWEWEISTLQRLGKPRRCAYIIISYVYIIYIIYNIYIYICRDVHCTHQTLRSFSKSCGLQQGTVERLRQELRRELLVENWGPRRPRRWRKLCGVDSNPGILEFSDQHIAGYEFVMDNFFSPGRS